MAIRKIIIRELSYKLFQAIAKGNIASKLIFNGEFALFSLNLVFLRLKLLIMLVALAIFHGTLIDQLFYAANGKN